MIDSDTGTAASTSPSRGAGGTSPSAADAAFWADAPHSIASYEAFLRDLPELMQSHLGQCAAYQDGVRWGIGPRRQLFFQEIYSAGADPQRMLFFTIEPQVPLQIELLTPQWDDFSVADD
jgi:hypothetical protein